MQDEEKNDSGNRDILTFYLKQSDTKAIPEINMIPGLREVSALLFLAEKEIATCSPLTILRSAIVLLAACWEAFIEDIVIQSFEFLVENIKNSTNLPTRLKQMIIKEINRDKNELRAWDLADSGWKNEAKKYASGIISKHVGRFNTPKSQPIRDLFNDVLGIEDITENWGSINSRSREEIREQIDKFVDLRCMIAHGKYDVAISREDLKLTIILVVETAVTVCDRARKHLHEITGRTVAEDYSGKYVMFLKDFDTERETAFVFKAECEDKSNLNKEKI